MTFSNPVVGGTTLIRPAIHSPDYAAGVSGWTINADGTAEFNNVTTRGPVVVNGDDQSSIRIQAPSGQPQVFFEAAQTVPGSNIVPGGMSVFTSPGIPEVGMSINGPWFDTNTGGPSIDMNDDLTGTARSQITIDADRIDLQA